ncbi:MAG: prepilin peptidase [Verrucomicrobiota bacterium]|jgi:leader peptidase (prepilin peptidase)/N-methyltransferase
MGIDAIFDTKNWVAVPFHFWSLVFFMLGCIVGSFLNVCIHRLPLGMSIVRPKSHCPHCKYSIPWHLNIPLVTWLALRGRCKNCGAPISPRYFVVELLTGVAFLSCWLAFGGKSAAVALVYAVFIAGMIAATFIDFEHFIIPDEITLGGIVAGLAASFFLPSLQGERTPGWGMLQSLIGMLVGAGVIYLILRMGKILFGRFTVNLDAESRVVFTESAILLPPKRLSLEQLYQRTSGWFAFQAEKVELTDRCYGKVAVAISATQIILKTFCGKELFDRAAVPHFETILERQLSSRETARLVGARWNPFRLLIDWFYSLFESLTRKLKIEILSGAHLVFTPTEAWLCRKNLMFEGGEIFYRKTDTISFHAREVVTQSGSWRDVSVRLTPLTLKIGDAEFNPEVVPRMEVVTDRMVLPREAMGLGDVKFMGAIGAFIGWPGVIFSLMLSSMIGAAVGVTLIAMRRREWSSRMPYGPYIALAAVIWIFASKEIVRAIFR